MTGSRYSGRPKKPTALKGLDGGKIGDLSAEPTPGVGGIVRPVGMTAKARREWDRLAPSLAEQGVLTWWDVEQFRTYCEAVSTAFEAAKLVEELGLLIATPTGGTMANPAVRIQRAAEDQAFRIGARFGLNPSDRAGLPARENKQPRGVAEFL